MATEPDKVDSGVLGTLILVLTFGVLGTALAVTALVRTEADQLGKERSQANETFAALRGSQEADLHLPPAYIDQSAGKVRLPIERAMQVVVRDLRRNPQSATWPKPQPQVKNGDGLEGEAAAAGDARAAGEDAPSSADEKLEQGKQQKKPRVPARPRPAAPVAPPQAPAPAPPAPNP